MHLLLYAPATSPRLQYICHFVFKELVSVDFVITTDREEFKNYEGVKIMYANEGIANDYFTIGNGGLLFENDIRQQEIDCFQEHDYKAFFKTIGTDFPFDIFAASFYLLSRFEEYLPHEKDIYGRYAHENSIAFKENFLHLPLINIWVRHLVKILQSRFPLFSVHPRPFTYIPTYDIDMAFSYKCKGLLRNTGGFVKSPSLERIKVLLGLKKDPFDSFEWLNQFHIQNNLQPIYFFLMAAKNSTYDKNILPQRKTMGKLIRQHAEKYAIGIHPSWQTGDETALLKKEKEQLENISELSVTKSRQHYIRFNLPKGYRLLMDSGITDDYSMGYGSINGFRASVASSFNWFDLEKNEASLLRIHPFCFMEANSFYEQKFTPAQAFDELMQYYSICKKMEGQLITIWHNNFLGTDPQFAEWRDIYERFIHQLPIDI
ncbi:MAG: polysaccharide deacetylase family protein [Ferruginibacter sp.]